MMVRKSIEINTLNFDIFIDLAECVSDLMDANYGMIQQGYFVTSEVVEALEQAEDKLRGPDDESFIWD